MRRYSVLLLDIWFLVAAAILAVYLRDNLTLSMEKLELLLPYLAATAVSGIFVLVTLGIDRGLWRYSSMRDYLRSLAGAVLVVVSATLLTFVTVRLEGVARSVPILHAMIAGFALIGARVLTRICHRYGGSTQGLLDPSSCNGFTLVVGLSSLAELYIKALDEYRPDGVRVGGVLDPMGLDGKVHGLPVFGESFSIATAVAELATHGVHIGRIVTAGAEARLPSRLRSELEDLRLSGELEVSSLVEQFGLDTGKMGATARTEKNAQNTSSGEIETFGLSPELLSAVAGRPYWVIKRGIDFVLAATLLIGLAPIFVIIALTVMVSIGRPAIFWQLRPGQYGRHFKLYKFRTMTAAREADGRVRSDDERQRSIGRFLRATRLDELPQIVNILRGEMSFVGPRPLLPQDQMAAYANRLLIRPGLTGWAQVHGGRAVSAADKAALDIWYVKHASFGTDMRIVLQTIPMLLFGEKVSRAAINAAWHDLQTGRPTE